jgi:hypothetical protein
VRILILRSAIDHYLNNSKKHQFSPQRREVRKEKIQGFLSKILCALCAFAVNNHFKPDLAQPPHPPTVTFTFCLAV